MAFCTKCGNQIGDTNGFCGKRGAGRGGSPPQPAPIYRRASKFEVFGIMVLVFFFATGFVGCSFIFPPLLLITLPAV